MKQAQGNEARSRSMAKRPPATTTAKVSQVVGGSGSGPEGEPSLELRIHKMAYAMYEARGCEDGHDLEDWLAAEAAVGREVRPS